MISGFGIYRDGKLLRFLGYGTKEGANDFAISLHERFPQSIFDVRPVKISVSDHP